MQRRVLLLIAVICLIATFGAGYFAAPYIDQRLTDFSARAR